MPDSEGNLWIGKSWLDEYFPAMPSESAQRALSHLRDPSDFQWYVIPLLLIVLYIYHDQIGRKNYSVVFAGLALWGMDWFNEIWNSLIFHFSGYAPAWAAPGETAYLILIGLNIEISFMFAIMGVATTVMLPSWWEATRSRLMSDVSRILYSLMDLLAS